MCNSGVVWAESLRLQQAALPKVGVAHGAIRAAHAQQRRVQPREQACSGAVCSQGLVTLILHTGWGGGGGEDGQQVELANG